MRTPTTGEILEQFISTQSDRNYHFWERRSRSIPLTSREMAVQKLNYIHNNPLQEKWKLSKTPELYPYSSAQFYENGANDFGFLKHLSDFI